MLPNNTLLHNRYRISRLLAAGGMGAVYKARDERLNVYVAVKEALVSNPALLVAFEKEAQRLARLRHLALPNVMDHFTEGYQQYLVMEYIEGEDLAEKLAKRGAPFSVDEVLGWADQLLAVLEYLHGQQPAIIHRDIKPQNVKVMPDNTLILLDFGLAKGGLTQHSRSGSSVYGYTLGYAPLEQMMGHGTNAQSDLYSVSATLWNLLTAQQPVDARLREQAATHRMPSPLRPANELNPNVPPPLAQLLHQALALHPNQRPPNATTMRAMLRHELERPQREQEAARRQAEEARRQAEVDKLQRELEAARRQAQQAAPPQSPPILGGRLANSPSRPPSIPPNSGGEARQLSPWNPLDHMRLLWWTLVTPQKLKTYKEKFDEAAVKKTGKWLVSSLIWLPFFLFTLALGLTLPKKWMQGTEYFWISGGLLIVWLFTGVFGDSENKNVAGLVVGLSMGLAVGLGVGVEPELLAVGLALELVVGLVRGLVRALAGGLLVGLATVLTIGIVVGMLSGLGVAAGWGIGRGVGLTVGVLAGVLAVVLAVVLTVGLAEVVKESLETDRPSWLARGVFGLLVAAHAFVVWFSFLEGWRMFGEWGY